MAEGLQPIEVVLKKEGSKIRAIPTDRVRAPSSPIFIGDEDFQSRGAILGEKWYVKMTAVRGDFVYTLHERADEKFITEVPGHWMNEETLFDIQAWLQFGEHICLAGPPGTGKTSFMERFAGAKEWKYVQIDCGTKQAVRDWFGVDAAKEATTFHQESRFARTLREAKVSPQLIMLIAFDEINRVHPLLHNSLLALLSNQRACEITTVDGTVIIEAPRNVRFMATKNNEANEPGAFTSGYAFRNRFQVVEVDFMPADIESSMLVAETGVSVTEANKVIQVVGKIREVIKNKKMNIPMPSYRDCRRAAALIKCGKGVKYACEHTFLPGLDGSLDQSMTVKAQVAEAIKSKLPI